MATNWAMKLKKISTTSSKRRHSMKKTFLIWRKLKHRSSWISPYPGPLIDRVMGNGPGWGEINTPLMSLRHVWRKKQLGHKMQYGSRKLNVSHFIPKTDQQPCNCLTAQKWTKHWCLHSSPCWALKVVPTRSIFWISPSIGEWHDRKAPLRIERPGLAYAKLLANTNKWARTTIYSVISHYY